MGRIMKKAFKHPREYYLYIFFYCIALTLGFWLVLSIYNLSEEEVYSHYSNIKITGDTNQRFSMALTKIMVKLFGKSGIISILSIVLLLGIYLLIKEIKEFSRYKYKCRLYHEGIIKDIYDIEDDYDPKGLIKSIKNLFSKTKKKQYKYPTKKELKNIEKKINDMRK
ncbi:MAG: hypothetical protein LBT27_03530 [Prevotellaceae bacterium]|jgi:hypothetical protein|nr:hypothetical protein [Prevotellaceae bacterium]